MNRAVALSLSLSLFVPGLISKRGRWEESKPWKPKVTQLT